MKKILTIGSFLLLCAVLLFWLPTQTIHKITFYDAESNEALSNNKIGIVYNQTGKEAYPSGRIFNGETDNEGSINLKGHKASNFKRVDQENTMLNYTILMNDNSSTYQIHKVNNKKGGRNSVYLIIESERLKNYLNNAFY